jgi:hypothetical protein
MSSGCLCFTSLSRPRNYELVAIAAIVVLMVTEPF